MTTPVNTSLTARFQPGAGDVARVPLRLAFGPMEGAGQKDVQCYPALAPEVFVTSGSLTHTGNRTAVITGVAVFTGGDVATLEFPITRLLSARSLNGGPSGTERRWSIDDPSTTGWFNLDHGRTGGFLYTPPAVSGDGVAASLRVENYALRHDTPFFGAYLVTYETSFSEYRWRHGAPDNRLIDYVGMCVATLPTGETATLVLTARDGGSTPEPDKGTPDQQLPMVQDSRTDLYRVVSEYVADPDGQWEKPPGFPDSTTYPGKPEVAGPDPDQHMVLKRVHEIGYVNRFGSVSEYRFQIWWEMPYSGASHNAYAPAMRVEWSNVPDESWQRAFERVDYARLQRGLLDRYPSLGAGEEA